MDSSRNIEDHVIAKLRTEHSKSPKNHKLESTKNISYQKVVHTFLSHKTKAHRVAKQIIQREIEKRYQDSDALSQSQYSNMQTQEWIGWWVGLGWVGLVVEGKQQRHRYEHRCCHCIHSPSVMRQRHRRCSRRHP